MYANYAVWGGGSDEPDDDFSGGGGCQRELANFFAGVSASAM